MSLCDPLQRQRRPLPGYSPIVLLRQAKLDLVATEDAPGRRDHAAEWRHGEYVGGQKFLLEHPSQAPRESPFAAWCDRRRRGGGACPSSVQRYRDLQRRGMAAPKRSLQDGACAPGLRARLTAHAPTDSATLTQAQ